MNQNINIQKENVLKAYKDGNKEQKTLLENLFGKDTFILQDITERVKTFEDVCHELGEEHPLVVQYEQAEAAFRGDKYTADLVAYLKLRILVATLNEGWEPQFTEDECRWYPWFYLYTQEEIDKMSEDERRRCVLRSGSYSNANSGLAFAYAYYASSYSSPYCGARLAFKSEELAAYAGRQFAELWADFCFIPDTRAE